MWAAIYTGPDITYLMRVLSQYYSNLRLIYCKMVIQILGYLFGTLNLRTIFTAESEDDLVAYTDSNYTGFIKRSNSIGSYIFILSNRPLSHQLKLQSTIAL